MSKKNETFEFLGKTYSMDKALNFPIADSRAVPLRLSEWDGGWMAITTTWFDSHVCQFYDDSAIGNTKLAAVRNLERQNAREFKRIAKALGYTVSG